VRTYVALLDAGKREEVVEVRPARPGLFEVKLRGKTHVVDAFKHDYGTLSLIVDDASYTATLDRRDGHVRVRVEDSVFPIEILDERRLRMRRAAARPTASGRQAVAAPLSGRVAKVLVAVGDAVRAGQALVVVDAMGMENELRSPKDGKVVELHVRAGEAVRRDANVCAVE
jgi:acetyl/propionyl-CoA carboxylase alpha subunit